MPIVQLGQAHLKGKGIILFPEKPKKKFMLKNEVSRGKRKFLADATIVAKKGNLHFKIACNLMPLILHPQSWLSFLGFLYRFLNRKFQCLKRNRPFLLISSLKKWFPSRQRRLCQHTRRAISYANDRGCAGKPCAQSGDCRACVVKEEDGRALL